MEGNLFQLMTKTAHKYEHVAQLLQMFPRKHVTSLLRHFSGSVHSFENGEWDSCINKAAKFAEAALKAVAGQVNIPLPPARQFKVGKIVNQLAQLDPKQFDDSFRLLIPRNIVFIYDVASNRGSRHDSSDIDANKMDAIAVAQNIAWVLAEMIRLAHKGALAPGDAADVVDGLMEKRYPDIEEIAGRIYVNRADLSAPEVALLVLERRYPSRMSRKELTETLCRQPMSKNKAQVTVTRIKKFTDDDGDGNLVLRSHGRHKAATIRGQGKA